MNSEEFQGVLHAGHQENAIEVPFDPARQWEIPSCRLWNGRHGHFVQGVINGIRFESVIVPRAKKFFVLVDEETATAAGVIVGDTVGILLEPLAVPVDIRPGKEG